MRKFLVFLIAVLGTLSYLYFTDKKIETDEINLPRPDSAVAEKLDGDLKDIKRKITVPVETRRSYLLDDKSIQAYNNQPASTAEGGGEQ